ncbi:inorganic diphosphatase [Aquisalinus flavus]|nr:inorganic diphosphatase [Aquisalinus flavus]UNE47893.1 inorganic diphosphatase [Aquisalinus flavus]
MIRLLRRSVQVACLSLMLAAPATMLAAPAAAQSAVTHPFAYPQSDGGGEFFVVVEIPAGSSIKYEIDSETGHLFVDRFLSMPVAYPANYGSIPSSLGADGDPLDALVLTRQPVHPGAMIRVRAIGMLEMIDDGEADHKILAVPASDVDPAFDGVRSPEDLPADELRRIEAFFRVYKQLPDPEDAASIKLGGYRSAAEATEMVDAALAAWRDQPGR